ncbi:acyl-CoA N-acyltransferase [Pilaira anomala]|nr:acyl-CoA N-acyltransferase [Pilaira anomala]
MTINLLDTKDNPNLSTASGEVSVPIVSAEVQRFLAEPVNCKLFVQKATSEYRLAEILSSRKVDTGLEYYVHYTGFNKRLDEWVSINRLDFSRKIEFPTTLNHHTSTTTSKKGVIGEGKVESVSSLSEANCSNRERVVVVEKLRSNGTTSNNIQEIARVKNLNKIQMGQHEIETWYFSPYPSEYAYCDILYICEFCLLFYPSSKQLRQHRNRCELHHPPGNEIYRNKGISFFEIDGRKQKVWCRNLCLLSKLFLDHKTLHYDVDPFLFYCMTERDERGNHLIGYFSKEKESSESYNVACILTLPQYQRLGYGRLLIGFSYELSKAEGKAGSPEKPLSDLGFLSYHAYWTETIVEYLLLNSTEDTTFEEISRETAITTDDIESTLTSIGALKYYRGQKIICLGDKVVEQWERNYEKRKSRNRIIVPGKLNWKPIHFTASQLRFR